MSSPRSKAHELEYDRVEVTDDTTISLIRYTLGLDEGDLAKCIVDGKIQPVVVLNGLAINVSTGYSLGLGETMVFNYDGLYNIHCYDVGASIVLEYYFDTEGWGVRDTLGDGDTVYERRVYAGITRLRAVAAGSVVFHGQITLLPSLQVENVY